MKKYAFLLFAIISLAGMLAISGCNRPETYIVTFNSNGGIGTMSAQAFTEGEAQALTRNAFTYEGCTFTGWNTVQGGSGASYTDGQTITATADMILYAQWTSNGTSGGGENPVPPVPAGSPTVETCTAKVTGLSAAVLSGNVTAAGDAPVTARGFMYGTSANNFSSSVECGSGTGSYTKTITGLTHSTTYYYKAYATNSAGTAYGEIKQFIVGVFSISASTRVCFSQGNLQYQASSRTWRFAENQYDIIGSANHNIYSSNTGWIDLFGWGTGSNPTNASTNYNVYSPFIEWGNNAISNGGNQSGLWRTLTKNEWIYLLSSRTNAASLVGKATVNGVAGLVLLPDNWTLPSDCTFTQGTGNSFDTNIYTIEQWNRMEQNGAVFLPAAGNRTGTSVYNVGSYGGYWSSSVYDSERAWIVYIKGSGADWNLYDRSGGLSVRLVQVVQN